MSSFLKHYPFFVLIIIILGIYYQLFLFGKIPFPGDLLVGSYYPWLDYYKIPVQNPLISDVFSQLFLWKYLSIDSFRNWQWPLWNPYSFTGTPLLADYQSATLYPLNILLFLPKYFGWGLFIFSQTLIGALGMYLLFSLWISSKLARLIGAIIFAFGGLMTTWVEQGIPVHGIIWLPLSLYFIEKFRIKKKSRYLLFLIASLSLTILAGHAQMFIYTFAIVVIYSLFFARLIPIFFSLIFVILICTPQLLPSLDLLNKSIRLSESYTDDSNFGLLPFQDIFKFFVADFFGNPVTRNYWGFLNYFETSGFLGTLTLPLILFSYIYLKRNGITIFFLSLFSLSLILVFDNPLSHTIYSSEIPFLTLSYASRMLFITTFAAAILSSFAIDQIINHDEIKKFFKLTLWSWAALVGVLVGLIVSYYLNPVTASVSIRNSVIPILFISIFFIFLIFLKKYKTLIFLVLFVLITFDLGRYFLKFNPFVPQNLIFPNVPAIQFLEKQPGQFRVNREHAEVFPPNTWIAYKIQSLEGYDPLYLNQYAKFINFLNGTDLRTATSSRYAEVTSNLSSPFIDAANVRFFIGIGIYKEKKGLSFPNGYNKVFQDKSSVILENPNALERAYFASSLEVGTQTQIEDAFMETKFDPRKKVFLSKDLKLGSITGKGFAKITEYSANVVKITTRTNSNELLILSDQYEEGWKAKIDDKETVISPANLIFRAIKVPKGEHEILFYYWPKSFEMGMKISAATGLVILIISTVAYKKRYL